MAIGRKKASARSRYRKRVTNYYSLANKTTSYITATKWRRRRRQFIWKSASASAAAAAAKWKCIEHAKLNK